ncbi:MAG: 5-bromo-4-chloroindolyl phosphate hydrolysis family protein [Coriobacteriaceae bacterium]|nr:5-bromo-4-chloroindolyl phosphate hydrolysis family protein [Coriobacteriaceae bacterium]
MTNKQPFNQETPTYETPGPGYPPPPDVLDSLNDLGSTVMGKVNEAVEAADFAGLSASVSKSIKSASTSFSQALAGPSPYIVRARGKKTTAMAKMLGFGYLAFMNGTITFAQILSLPEEPFISTFCAVATFGGLTYLFGKLTRNAHRDRKLLQYLERLARIASTRQALTLEEIAFRMGSSLDEVTNMVQAGISQGYIPHGRIRQSLDGKTVLYLTDYAFKEAGGTDLPKTKQKTSERIAARNKTAAPAPETAAGNDTSDATEIASETPINPKVTDAVAKGKDYIQRIRLANNIIQEKEMSDKLDVLEKNVRRITARVNERPDTVDQLTQFLNYYLPTTGKLVDAYADLDKHDEHGPNAEATRREIKTTLDVINESFNKLADDLLQDAAWDLQGDMHVLRTMLTQDGLADDHGPRADSRPL